MSEPSGVKTDLDVRGQLIADAPLGAQSWFRCGGTADLLFVPSDREDLSSFMQQWPEEHPLLCLGGMANVIIRDGGVRGAVVRLGKAFAAIEVEGDEMTVGAGALNGSVASAAAKVGLGGLEFLSGIPGTIGGAVAMNAGAYGAEIKDILVEAQAITRAGDIVRLSADDLKMRYRHAEIPDGAIIIGARFKGTEEDRDLVRTRLKEIKAKRNETQPIREDTGGSTFANPSDDLRAWQVVDQVGGRGLQIGGAKMSEKHCNFMLNTGSATAKDLENLGDELIRRTQEKLGVTLRWEIKRVGEKPCSILRTDQ